VRKLSLSKTVCIICLFSVATAIRSSGTTTFVSLVSFNGTNGANPQYAPLVQGLDGNFYGTTSAGGAGTVADGTVFKITSAGTLTTIYSFCSQTNCADGSTPFAGLVLGTDGNFYGTTEGGGSNGDGTVFKVTPTGTLTTLHSFDSTDGALPRAGLVQGTDGNFYGTTEAGGADNDGTVFKVTPTGKFITLHSFDSTDGANPFAGLVQGTDGNFYGTTDKGGANGDGTVFRITTSGTLTTLHSFDFTDGANPFAGLVQGSDGNLYGTASQGGTDGLGTVFKITISGKLTTLHSFADTDGLFPTAGLVQATDGNFYATASSGGANSGGTIFEITTAGTLTTLYNFCSQISCTDGDIPEGGLLQATNGTLYGTTEGGGVNNDGTVFSISAGLAAFVETLPSSGKVGASVKILGSSLTGASSVSFNGVVATFKVVSASEITTTVPVGATTGTVQVTTPSGTLNSNAAFRVTPQITSFTPPSGIVTTPVTITGVSLKQTTKVAFGGVAATVFTVNSDTQVTATVPSGAKTGKIVITTPGGTAASATNFLVTPQILSFSPPSGPVGTPVTITGVSLLQTTQVTFGGVAATKFTVNSDTQVTATVPTGAITGPIGITTPGGGATSTGTFTVTQ
jgi:uncharacterized repeat protein (TIGR03803 family)